MAAGALRALREAGRRVPDDVAVVGFDDAPVASLTLPTLTTIRQPLDEMADVGGRVAPAPDRRGQRRKAEQIICATTLVERASA